MVTYVCIRNCFWGDKFWQRGETLTWIDEKSNPPHHFVILKEEDAQTLADNFKNDTQLKKK